MRFRVADFLREGFRCFPCPDLCFVLFTSLIFNLLEDYHEKKT
jgi:hypothetical protein